MADDEYIEVPAVVRMPKGERLADSRKTEGWSRGFTPKSSDKGPEHVEIRLTGKGDASADGPEPEVVYIHEYVEPQKTREEEEAEELLRLLVVIAVVKAAEWAQPHVRRLLTEHVLPFLVEKRKQWRERVARRRAAKGRSSGTGPGAVRPAEGTRAALSVYEADMTSDEARRHLVELLIAEHFVNEKRRLLANARIAEDVPSEVAGAVQALTPKQVAKALESILASKATVLDDIRWVLAAGGEGYPRQLEGSRLHEVLRLTQNE
ncbi:hypothetical protein ICW40_05750 [Actinotalea ferrariae]|uniref:hypothetical protein n=1 Tax=Actinotalea ferrariae TaxID=1386098 RepID=UPI001C8B101F|nr:hypothetical protein [Actinotalea ferrariae]MBX9244310.1 hypothetical protein [Actinotalea ferrariae]